MNTSKEGVPGGGEKRGFLLGRKSGVTRVCWRKSGGGAVVLKQAQSAVSIPERLFSMESEGGGGGGGGE